MHTHKLTVLSLLAVGCIYLCTAVAWFILGGALTHRSVDRSGNFKHEVMQTWGPELRQAHPVAWYDSPAGATGRSAVSPSASAIDVKLGYEPKRKGLFWYRTYTTEFEANYGIPNPTPIDQTVYVAFTLPSQDASFNAFTFELDGAGVDEPVLREGTITQAVVIPAHSSAPLKVTYHARGLNRWDYNLGNADRVQNFVLTMQSDFKDINFPAGTGSPTSRSEIAAVLQRVSDFAATHEQPEGEPDATSLIPAINVKRAELEAATEVAREQLHRAEQDLVSMQAKVELAREMVERMVENAQEKKPSKPKSGWRFWWRDRGGRISRQALQESMPPTPQAQTVTSAFDPSKGARASAAYEA